ncbi:hypothetical protein WJ17_22415 [Burkholderia vietnamiensis]|nr:hypothetical protein WJ17_22415 [Burkholderia vietnamiensis]
MFDRVIRLFLNIAWGAAVSCVVTIVVTARDAFWMALPARIPASAGWALPIVWSALFAVGILVLVARYRHRHRPLFLHRERGGAMWLGQAVGWLVGLLAGWATMIHWANG